MIILAMYILSTNYNKTTPNNWSIYQESLYSYNICIATNQNAPLIQHRLIYILINNLVGMVPL